MDEQHTVQKEQTRLRALHLIRDERDREVEAQGSRWAGRAVLLASQALAAVCLWQGEPIWTAFLALTFLAGAARGINAFRADGEKAYLLLGLAGGAAAAVLLWLPFRAGLGLSLGRLALLAVIAEGLSLVTAAVLLGLILGAFTLKGKLGRLDGEQWDAYFRTISTVGLLWRFSLLAAAALALAGLAGWGILTALDYPAPERLALIFCVAKGAGVARKFSREREELIGKLLRRLVR